MTDKTHDIRSVQIIRIEETEFVFDYDAVKEIIDSNPECAELPVAIVIINGALRTGKSFFINIVIRHLLKEAGAEPDHNMLRDYFRSRRGPDIQTLGIWALNKIFVHDGKAIILMDTQGIFDRQLNQAMTTALICLSTLISSYQIYNLDKRIQEDHLNNMAYFSAYTDLMTDLGKDGRSSDEEDTDVKVGQTLSLLVRDWQNFEDVFDLENCKRETDKYQDDFLFSKSKDDVKRNTRKRIMNTFDEVNVRLCPHPGHMVTEGVFTGKLDQVRKEFMIHMDYIIGDILSNLEPKRISSNIELICSDVPDFMRRYVDLYRNVKEDLPEPRTILETTSKISQTGAKTGTVGRYKQVMMEQIRNGDLTREEIETLHVSAKNRAYKYFNEMCVMGEDDEILSIMKSIDTEIDEEYTNFLRMAVERNLMFRVNQLITMVIRYFTALMSMDFKEMGLKIMIPLLMVMRYVIGAFLPSSLYYVFDWIIGNVIWILIGMVILQVTQDPSDIHGSPGEISHEMEAGRIRRKSRSRKVR
jgi:atlastin